MFDRVQQITATTGTGSYTISGPAPSGYRTFLEAATSFASKYSTTDFPCCYLVTLGALYEIGYGKCNSTGTTLTRDYVITSSSGDNTAVSWASGDKIITMVPSSFAYQGHGFRHQFQTGSAYPNGDDDLTQGYGRGSTWQNGDGKLWVCVAEDEADALWTRVLPGIVEPNSGTWWPGAPDATLYGASMYKTDGGVDPAPRSDHSLMLADVTSSNTYHARGGTIAGRVRTTNATAGLGLTLVGSPTGAIVGKGVVVAFNETDVAAKTWEFSFTAKSATGTLTFVGTPDITSLEADGAMASASFDVIITAGSIILNTVGIASKNITWSINVQAAEVYLA